MEFINLKLNKMKAKYKVELHFSGELTNTQKDKIVERILNSLIHESMISGLVTDDAEEFTTAIIVTRENTNTSLGRDLISGELI
jgi:uncharacterized protein YihD (DUF1040 family)